MPTHPHLPHQPPNITAGGPSAFSPNPMGAALGIQPLMQHAIPLAPSTASGGPQWVWGAPSPQQQLQMQQQQQQQQGAYGQMLAQMQLQQQQQPFADPQVLACCRLEVMQCAGGVPGRDPGRSARKALFADWQSHCTLPRRASWKTSISQKMHVACVGLHSEQPASEIAEQHLALALRHVRLT